MKKIILGILIFTVPVFCSCFFLTGKTKAQGENYGDWEQTSSSEPIPGSEGLGSEDIYIPADNPEPGNPDAMTLEQNSALVGPISVSDDEGGGAGAGGAGASGETLKFAPGNEFQKTPEGGFAYKMIDENGVENYYTIKNGQAYLYEGGTGGGAGQGNIPAAPQPVGVAPDGAFVYKDPQTGGLIFNDGAVVEDPSKVTLYSGNGAGSATQNGITEVQTIDGQRITDDQGRTVMENAQGQNGFIDKNGKFVLYDVSVATGTGNTFFNAATGQVMMMNEKNGFYDVQYDANGKNPYVLGEDGKTKWTIDDKGQWSATDEKGNKLTLDANGNVVSPSGGSVPAGSAPTTSVLALKGGTANGGYSSTSGGILGGASSWLGNLLGLSGGVGYNSKTGLSGGLGFNSSSGYGASSGGGILSSLFGTSGTGTSTSGGFGYTPGQGWSGGMGFSSGTGTVGYSGAGGYGGMGYFGMGGGGWNPGNYLSTGLPAGSIYNIIQSVALWILAIFGFICIIGFVISGIMYLTAAGDDKQQEKAKKALYYSIMGVIVGLVGLVIIFAVNSLLRGASYF